MTGINPQRTLLFLGAGFSFGALDAAGAPVSMGKGLKERIVCELNRLMPGRGYEELSLQECADELGSQSPSTLRTLLLSVFQISKISAEHSEILTKNWLRIYTTNYDDLIDVFEQQNKNIQKRNKYIFRKDKPNRPVKNSIFYLHGSIVHLSSNPLEDLVIGEQSYLEERLSSSPLYTNFTDDILNADKIVFLGYSARDPAISRLLISDRFTKEKTIFYISDIDTEAFAGRLRQFGNVDRNSHSGLLAHVNSYVPQEGEGPLQQFNKIEVSFISLSKQFPTLQETSRFLVSGAFDRSRYQSFLKDDDFLLPFLEQVEQINISVKQKKSVLISGSVGNGKTNLIEQFIKNRLTKGLPVYELKSTFMHVDLKGVYEDIRRISSDTDAVIVFDGFFANSNIIKKIKLLEPSVSIVSSERTALVNERFNQVSDILGEDLSVVNIGAISSDDLKTLNEIFSKIGSDKLAIRNKNRNVELRDVILSQYENTTLGKKIIDSVQIEILDIPIVRKGFIYCMLFPRIGFRINSYTLRELTDSDVFYNSIMRLKNTNSDFFDFRGDELTVRSGTIANFFLRSVFNASEIVDICVELAKKCAERARVNRKYMNMFRNIVSYSFLKEILVSGESTRQYLRDMFYEKLRLNIYINKMPLFWLQYAIMELDSGEHEMARQHINHAYRNANDIRDYKTYQLDTFLLKILSIQILDCPKSKFDDIFDEIDNCISSNISIANVGNHFRYVKESFDDICQSVRRLDYQLNNRQKNIFIHHFNLMIKECELISNRYPHYIQAARELKQNLSETVRHLTM